MQQNPLFPLYPLVMLISCLIVITNNSELRAKNLAQVTFEIDKIQVLLAKILEII